MVYVVLDYYTCGAGLYGYCGTVLLYVWCRIKWLLWYCITICVVQDYMVTVVIYDYTCDAGLYGYCGTCGEGL